MGTAGLTLTLSETPDPFPSLDGIVLEDAGEFYVGTVEYKDPGEAIRRVESAWSELQQYGAGLVYDKQLSALYLEHVGS